MRRWVAKLWDLGLRQVDGRLVGDDRLFPGEALGPGWAWDDLAWGYGAPVGALEPNVDAAQVAVTPGAHEGEAAAVTLSPAESALNIESAVFTGPAEATTALS